MIGFHAPVLRFDRGAGSRFSLPWLRFAVVRTAHVAVTLPPTRGGR